MWGTSPDGAHPGLHLKDAVIGQVLALHSIAVAAIMVDDFGRIHKTLTKTYF